MPVLKQKGQEKQARARVQIDSKLVVTSSGEYRPVAGGGGGAGNYTSYTLIFSSINHSLLSSYSGVFGGRIQE